jgi:hypothetical protein
MDLGNLMRKLSLLDPAAPPQRFSSIEDRQQESYDLDPRGTGTGRGWMQAGIPQVGSNLYNPTPQRQVASPYMQLQPANFYAFDVDNAPVRSRLGVQLGMDDLERAALAAKMGRPQS